MEETEPSVFGTVIFIAIGIACIGGYIANMVKIVHLLGGPVSSELLIRIGGVIVPFFGILMGYIH